MTEEEISERAFAMPLTNPAFPPGPYRFVNREYLIITYRTDPERLRAIVPEPLALEAPLVKYEFIRMPDSTGFGDYTESGQVIPVSLNGRRGSYTHSMFLDDESAIAGGRELWGFPKKLASPEFQDREGHACRHPRLRSGARSNRHDGLQTPHARRFADQACNECAEFPLESHSARRWHGAHLRARRIPAGGCRGTWRVGRTRLVAT